MLEHLKAHLKGKVVFLAVGNIMRSDDAAGPLLAEKIRGKVPFEVIDAGVSPENYLEKVIGLKPDCLVMFDAVDFGAKPGEFKELKAQELKTVNIFFTHNASLSMAINYLQSNLKLDIIILIIQPKTITLGGDLSLEVAKSLDILADWFVSFSASNG
ncbi:MAG: hydrogenase maturation protease [Candidatus Omnitrophica bacterium]|nr:hydrogenase maturation protease [Candidatus Omnitrophota bacterium]